METKQHATEQRERMERIEDKTTPAKHVGKGRN